MSAPSCVGRWSRRATSRCRQRDRQSDAGDCAAALARDELDRAALQCDQPANDRQPQPGATLLRRVKRLEQALRIDLTEPYASIRNVDAAAGIVLSNGDLD